MRSEGSVLSDIVLCRRVKDLKFRSVQEPKFRRISDGLGFATTCNATSSG